MTPERAAGMVGRWARFYTRKLPPGVADRRVEELRADLHDQIVHERAHGSSDRRIALSILSRMVRGLGADFSWRDHAAYRSTVGIVLATAFVLALPLLAMQFTDEVVWAPADFAVAGALLAGSGLVCRAASRRARATPHRAAVGIAGAAVLMLAWSVLAVGVTGKTGDPADLMYAGVIGVGIAGAGLARFRPRGMARALLAMALAQALAAVVALAAGKHQAPFSSVAEIAGLNGVFVALFAGSALLFRRAARKQPALGG